MTRHEPKLPTWFKIWSAICVTVVLTFFVLIIWAIIDIVKRVTL